MTGSITPPPLRAARAAVVVLASVFYLSHVFRVFGGPFWTHGMGDWMDPYFINALLEHWYHAVRTLSDPSSPPMFFPAPHTLGYSHGLVLYAPFYVPLRLLLHPFQAYNVALFAVIETGIVCLYLIFRRFMGLSFVESLLLTALFFTSQNVVNDQMGVWSQRASVFLIPPILLLLLASRRMQARRGGLLLAGLSGFLAALMFTQDFYTALFASFFLVFPAAFVLIERREAIAAALSAAWRDRRPGEWLAFAVLVPAAAWTLYVWTSGGGDVRIAGIRLSSHDWRRPALLTLASLAIFLWLHGTSRLRAQIGSVPPWLRAVGAGLLAGIAVFLWIYLDTYRRHPAFPESDLINQLVRRDSARWTSPLAFVRDLPPYATARSFWLMFAAALLAWVPAFKVSRTARVYWAAAASVSALVLVVPLSIDGFSIWRALFEPLPGFSAIRDPKRIVYLYELAVGLAIGLLLAMDPRGSGHRITVTALAILLLVAVRNPDVFSYARPNGVYDHWITAPIAVDPSCKSFFIARASREYTSRSKDMWTLYGMDATFVSLTRSIPTLNGYSAWVPEGWDLFNPEEEVYAARVRRWVEAQALTGVCELDVVARTMRPYAPLTSERRVPGPRATDAAAPASIASGAGTASLRRTDAPAVRQSGFRPLHRSR